MTIDELAMAVRNREDFLKFLEALCVDFESNRDAWENDRLDSFLDAMLGWCQGLDGLRENMGYEVEGRHRWQLLTDALMAARIYE